MMPAVPLPFVIALLLAILLFQLIRQNEPSLRPAIIFTAACTLMVIIGGLRWTFDVRFIRFLQPVMASMLPAIAWYCFTGAEASSRIKFWLHLAPVGVVTVLSFTWAYWFPPIDLLLAGLYFVYGVALIRMASRGPDALPVIRFSETLQALKATKIAGCTLIISAVSDVLIAGDFDFYQGAHAATIVAVVQLLLLPVIVYGVVTFGRSIPEGEGGAISPTGESAPVMPENVADNLIESIPQPEMEPVTSQEASSESGADDQQIIQHIDQIMRQQQLFRDPDLNLNRLARRAGIPSRQISGAINRVYGRNVSQVVNEYRIEEAKRLLQETDLPVTSLLFEAGFQTKSNFNREFQRVAGMTPSDYRRSVSSGE
ncbi:AraC-type DNA-binding domain-containing protein [Hahella chejuensis KCTC 2396]|uniref:AraC-type DNA-binding domain-containing protein n=1 Tax=Hahella chejuensis (strain KCTC 2396) TaxID=349521 RepID=Q2SHV1_HAHCH|nr:AraC family transcriptional regulator [Hahella chejuensis]ABC29773.1 AraC-type DNA-binding domain-containing protein [Hahella chejuensis KCTC 2396]